MRLHIGLIFIVLCSVPARALGDGLSAWPDVNLTNANVVIDRTEIRLYWAGPSMELRRVYNSRVHADGPLGFGWRMSYSRALARVPGASTLAITEDDGSVTRYRAVPVQQGELPRFEVERCCTPHTVEQLPGGTYRRTRDGLAEIFDPQGRFVEARDGNGLAVKFAYGTGGLSKISDTAGRAFVLERTPEGRVAKAREQLPGDRKPRVVEFAYSKTGDLVSVVDALGGKTEYAYDDAHRVTNIVQPTLERATLGYDVSRDWVTSLKTPGGRALAYVWTADAKGHGVLITDEAGRVTRYRYEGERLTITDPLGAVTRQERCIVCGGYYETVNALGGKSSHAHPDATTFVGKDAAGGTERVNIDPATRAVTRREDRAGGVTRYLYDTRGNLTKVLAPDGGETLVERDSRGFAKAVIRADGVRVNLGANPLGLPDRIEEPGGAGTTIEYDAAGLPRKIADASGRAITITYNALDQPLTIADSAGPQRDFRYDDAGRVITETAGANHQRVTYTYGGADAGTGEGRLVRAAYGTAAEARFSYDEQGNVTRVLRDGRPYSIAYDAASRPVAMTDPASSVVKLAYDAAGNATAVTDPLGHVTRSTYDAASRLATRADPTGRTWAFSYDGEGRVRALKLPGDREVAATYDASGRLVALRPPAGAGETYAYTPIGRVKQVSSALGGTTKLDYDATGRPREADDPVLGKVQYAFTSDGRLAEVKASGQTITIAYDDKARSRKVTTSSGQVIETKLDWDERRIEENGPGYHLRWSWSDDGYLRDVTDLADQRADRYEYDGLGNRTSWTDPDGRVTSYTYDVAGRLEGLADRLGPRIAFQYDAAGRRTQRQIDSGVVTRYRHDDAGRLVELAHSFRDKSISVEKLTYAPSGAIRAVDLDGRVATSSPDASDRLVAPPPIVRDGVKSETAPRTFAYQYDPLARLVGAALGAAGEVKLGYGPDLHWAGFTGPAGTARFVYETDNIVAEGDEKGAISSEYVIGPGQDEPLAMKRDGRVLALLADHLGSITRVVDGSGVVVREAAYTAAGDLATEKGVPCTFGFTGRPREPHTGLVNLRLRWYNPRLSQFQTQDPLIPASRLDYAGGNAVTFVDPLGAAVDAWMTQGAFASAANLAAASAGPVLVASAGAAALSAFAAPAGSSLDHAASLIVPGFRPAHGRAADALARTLVRTAAGRAVGRSLVDTSPYAGPARLRTPGVTAGPLAAMLERLTPVPDRRIADRVFLNASSRALTRGLFPSAGRHVAHRVMDAVGATGPLDAPSLSVAEVVQDAIAEALTMRVNPPRPKSNCERFH